MHLCLLSEEDSLDCTTGSVYELDCENADVVALFGGELSVVCVCDSEE